MTDGYEDGEISLKVLPTSRKAATKYRLIISAVIKSVEQINIAMTMQQRIGEADPPHQ